MTIPTRAFPATAPSAHGHRPPAPPIGGRRPARTVARGLVALTKPRIIELLLVTTVPAMSFVEQPPTYAETQHVQRFQASLSAFSAVWGYLALVAILFWLLFYAL